MMRIRRLDLVGFGHFSGRSFDFGARPKEGGADFHMIYGPNEAGKTTLMQGYLRLLYGFRPRDEPYAFHHDRAALRVAADLEIDGRPMRFARVAGRSGTLRDASDAPLPETALSPALAGLGPEEYGKLLCLDDETIEAGGDEISRSEGRIGELMFSASAGITALSRVLDAARDEALDLFRKGGTKSEAARCRQRLNAIDEEIKALDITAAQYRRLTEDLSRETEAEARCRSERTAAGIRVATAKAVADALPVAVKLAADEASLAPLSGYPDPAGIDADALAGLQTRRAELAVERRHADARRARLLAERAKLDRAPDLAAKGPVIADLRPLRDRCAAAAVDLPRRRDELRAAETAIGRALTDLGLAGHGGGTAGLPPAPVLADLQRRVDTLARATAAHATAQEESRAAQAAHGSAAKRTKQARDRLAAAPDPAPVLERYAAASVADRAVSARQTLRQARKRADSALAALAEGGRRFDTVPPLPLTAAEAAQAATALAEARAELRRLDVQRGEAATRQVQLAKAVRDLTEAAGPLTDAGAAAARARRDTAWTDHRASLSPETAETFAAAMLADDALGAARLAGVDTLAELRARTAQLQEARDEAERLGRTRDLAETALDGLTNAFAGHLRTIGLPAGTEAGALADWLRRAEAARDAAADLTAEEAAAAADLAAAEALRAALADTLDAPDATLEALIGIARARADERRDLAADLRGAEEQEAAAAEIAATRAERAEAAGRAAGEAAAALERAARDALGALPSVAIADALPALAALREEDARRAEIAHRVDAMTRDEAAFATALADLTAGGPVAAPVTAFDALALDVEAAAAAETTWASLESDLADQDRSLRDLAEETERVEAALAQIAGAFAPDIATDTPEALREAVAASRRAGDLRDRIQDHRRALCECLGTATPAEALARLEGATQASAEAGLAEARARLADAEAAHETAIDARATAAAARDRVTGGDEVAVLVAERQTLELELESLILRHAELQLGHQLARLALGRYRDRHRSAMMRAADAAFAELTNGAYSGLLAQPSGDGEVLFARQAADGAVKAVQTLSKGTRFQLYLALRAAAYDQMAAGGTVLPFFCDDVFETFDEDRTRAACRLMRGIGRTGQAIYLTHHRHVVEIARETCGDDVRVQEI